MTEILKNRPAVAPQMNLIWTAIVDIAPRIELGRVPTGDRFMVPILGGEFFGGPDNPEFNGNVLAGGADRQFIDSAGLKHLDALYEMQVTTGEIVTIRNRVIIDELGESPYKISHIQVIAPKGRFEWMNRRVFLGTLETARPDREAVIIRGWGQR